jgi:hypothetical protein
MMTTVLRILRHTELVAAEPRLREYRRVARHDQLSSAPFVTKSPRSRSAEAKCFMGA